MILTFKILVQCVRRQAQSQVARSRYSAETFRRKVVRAFWSLVYLCYAVWVGITFLRREVLGEHVIYRGRRCFVLNWANSDSPTLGALEGPRETLQHCNRDEIVTIYSPSTFLFRFVGGFAWWADSWFSIAVDKRLHPAAFAHCKEAT